MIFCVENETSFDPEKEAGITDPEAFCSRIGDTVFAILSIEVPSDGAEASLYLVGEETIREMNRTHRGIDAVTDVLSFPNLDGTDAESPAALVEGAGVDSRDPETGRILLGDIVICTNRILSQAEDFGHSPLREFSFLLTHSLLHLLGFDHETAEEAAVMEELQEKVLNDLGIRRG